MKKIKLGDIVLLALAGLLDIFQEIKDPFNLFSNYYQNLYGFIPKRYKKDHFRHLITYLLNRKLIEKRIIKNEPCFNISKNGLNNLYKKFPNLFFKNKKWDRKWRLVVFDISEIDRNKRDYLRRTLKIYGFRYLQKSVWISPFDFFNELESFISKFSIEKQVVLIETNEKGIRNKNIVFELWPIKEFNEVYKKTFKDFGEIYHDLQTTGYKKIIDKKFKIVYKKLLNITLKDPHLPTELTTYNLEYQNTIRLAKKIRRLLYQANRKIDY